MSNHTSTMRKYRGEARDELTERVRIYLRKRDEDQYMSYMNDSQTSTCPSTPDHGRADFQRGQSASPQRRDTISQSTSRHIGTSPSTLFITPDRRPSMSTPPTPKKRKDESDPAVEFLKQKRMRIEAVQE